MRIYLADLAHRADSNPFFAPLTTPLGIGYLAATLRASLDECDVELFRDPDELLHAIHDRHPDLLGFTLTSWNTDLTRRVITLAKTWSAELPVVVGGPSVDDTDGPIAELLSHGDIDFAVPSEGEPGMLALVRFVESGAPRREPIPGVAFLQEGRLVRGPYERPPLDEIPSPYLTGVMDRFLEQGMIPIVQTMRGCPYRCEFCVSGSSLWSKFGGYPLDRVRAELDHLAAAVPGSALILTDENFGLLKERDVELAEYLVDLRARTGFPSRIYYYTAKIVTSHCRTIAELFAPFAWIGAFPMAFQTLNEEAKKAVKRTNISLGMLRENVQWAEHHAVTTASDMVYLLPHETAGTFMRGVETLLESGVQRVNAYGLLLFPGIDMHVPEKREEYGLVTAYRPMPNNYGSYWDGRVFSAEVEEVVVATRWATFDDYLCVRRFLFFTALMLSKDYFAEMMELGFADGLPMFQLPRHLATCAFDGHEPCRRLMRDYDESVRAELLPTPEEAYERARERAHAGEDVGGLRPNLVFAGRLLGTEETIFGLLSEIERFVALHGAAGDLRVLRNVREVMAHRLARLVEGTRIDASGFEVVGGPR